MAIKTFCGSCATLISTIANVMTLILLKGESGWVCLLVCSADILFSALVLHAITNKDHQGNPGTNRATNGYSSENNAAMRNATEVGIRISSIVKSHGQQSSVVATDTTFIGPRLDRNLSTSTEVHYDIEQTSEGRQEANVRPEGSIAKCVEYSSNGLDFITSAEIATDVSSNGDGSQYALSDEEMAGRHERYEERVLHKLV
ncbi:hypothetical protein TWF281_007879 [Arthrobotrys megalospora]